MWIILNDNIQTNAPKPTDSRYSNNLTSWLDVAEVNANTDPAVRYIGLSANINGIEYWYQNGITDSDLVVKKPLVNWTFNMIKSLADEALLIPWFEYKITDHQYVGKIVNSLDINYWNIEPIILTAKNNNEFLSDAKSEIYWDTLIYDINDLSINDYWYYYYSSGSIPDSKYIDFTVESSNQFYIDMSGKKLIFNEELYILISTDWFTYETTLTLYTLNDYYTYTEVSPWVYLFTILKDNNWDPFGWNLFSLDEISIDSLVNIADTKWKVTKRIDNTRNISINTDRRNKMVRLYRIDISPMIYDNAATYNKNDIVIYDNMSYACFINNTIWRIPTNTQYWVKISSDSMIEYISPHTGTYYINQQITFNVINDDYIVSPILSDTDYNNISDDERIHDVDIKLVYENNFCPVFINTLFSIKIDNCIGWIYRNINTSNIWNCDNNIVLGWVTYSNIKSMESNLIAGLDRVDVWLIQNSVFNVFSQSSVISLRDVVMWSQNFLNWISINYSTIAETYNSKWNSTFNVISNCVISILWNTNIWYLYNYTGHIIRSSIIYGNNTTLAFGYWIADSNIVFMSNNILWGGVGSCNLTFFNWNTILWSMNLIKSLYMNNNNVVWSMYESTISKMISNGGKNWIPLDISLLSLSLIDNLENVQTNWVGALSITWSSIRMLANTNNGITIKDSIIWLLDGCISNNGSIENTNIQNMKLCNINWRLNYCDINNVTNVTFGNTSNLGIQWDLGIVIDLSINPTMNTSYWKTIQRNSWTDFAISYIDATNTQVISAL